MRCPLDFIIGSAVAACKLINVTIVYHSLDILSLFRGSEDLHTRRECIIVQFVFTPERALVVTFMRETESGVTSSGTLQSIGARPPTSASGSFGAYLARGRRRSTIVTRAPQQKRELEFRVESGSDNGVLVAKLFCGREFSLFYLYGDTVRELRCGRRTLELYQRVKPLCTNLRMGRTWRRSTMDSATVREPPALLLSWDPITINWRGWDEPAPFGWL